MYSVDVDNTNPSALGYCLNRLENGIEDFYDWTVRINAGGIDYGIYLNIDVEDKIVEISNTPNGDEACLDDILEELEEEDE